MPLRAQYCLVVLGGLLIVLKITFISVITFDIHVRFVRHSISLLYMLISYRQRLLDFCFVFFLQFLSTDALVMPNKKKKGFNRPKNLTDKAIAGSSPSNNRSSIRKQWSNEQMQAALKSVVSDGVSANKAALLHGVPRSTLKDRLSGRVVHGRNPGPEPYLNGEEEKELVGHLINASNIGYGKTRQEVLNIV